MAVGQQNSGSLRRPWDPPRVSAKARYRPADRAQALQKQTWMTNGPVFVVLNVRLVWPARLISDIRKHEFHCPPHAPAIRQLIGPEIIARRGERLAHDGERVEVEERIRTASCARARAESCRRVPSAREATVRYKGLALDGNYRIDLLVEDTIIVELKSWK
jgi:hypothetical protein